MFFVLFIRSGYNSYSKLSWMQRYYKIITLQNTLPKFRYIIILYVLALQAAEPSGKRDITSYVYA